MRTTIQWLGVFVVGGALASACSASDDKAMTPVEIARIKPSDSAGTAGKAGNEDTEPSAGTAGVRESNGGAAGAAGMPEGDAGAAGGGNECEGFYECPEVLYWSHATLEVDLPISIAEAADAIFTACRNSECHSAKGGALVNSPDGQAWHVNRDGGDVLLTFGGPESAPFATLEWGFTNLQHEPFPESDRYSLSVQATGAATPTTLFDERVAYSIAIVDKNYPGEHYCSHCFEVSVATVDERSVN